MYGGNSTGPFGKLVVAGVGPNFFERDEAQAERIAKGVQGEASDDDVHAQTFAASS